MNVGDLVRFTKGHSAQAGLDYCEEWVGTIINMNDTSIEIQWFSHPYLSGPSNYDERWWNALDYEPFEVINENR